jgi:NAD(P)-dependent dehydrogenase (short-subunit alcohol dehydrogenase family)
MSAATSTTTRPTMVVTGGARGIGLGISELAVERGYDVHVVDLDEAGLAELEGHPGITGHRLNVTDFDAFEAWASALVAAHGAPDALVNNAGILRPGRLEELSIEDWRDVVEVNLTGVFVGTRVIGRAMVEAGRGSIVSIASVGAVSPSPLTGAYPPAKAGVAMLMEMAAVEWGPHGVRSNSVSPAVIRAGLAADVYLDEELTRRRTQAVPLRRLGEVEDVAYAVLYLCSEEARFVNGHNLVVDGGLTRMAVSTAARPGA